MTALRLPWFEDEHPRDLRRWAVAAAVVLGVHLGTIGLYAYLHQPEEIGDDTSPITVDLTPSDDTIDQPEIAPVPESAAGHSRLDRGEPEFLRKDDRPNG